MAGLFRRVGLGSLCAAALSTALSVSPAGATSTSTRYDQMTSSTWSGYVVYGAQFTEVTGTWKQPTVTCSDAKTSASAVWVGFDGDPLRGGSNTVEQTGTSSDCYRGAPRYSAWYEFYPSPSVNLSSRRYPVSPGDVITATVRAAAAKIVSVTLTNTRNGGQLWSYTSKPRKIRAAAFGTAEWIVEAPSSCGRRSCRVLPLADISSVAFTNASVSTADGSDGPGGVRWGSDTLTLQQDLRQAVPSLSPTHRASFDITVG